MILDMRKDKIMPEYRVRWEIDIQADTPQQAAELARGKSMRIKLRNGSVLQFKGSDDTWRGLPRPYIWVEVPRPRWWHRLMFWRK